VDGYVERESLILALAGPSVSGSWDREESLSDLYDLKGMFRSLISYLDIDGIELTPSKSLHPALRNSLNVTLDGTLIGVVGQVAPHLSRAFDLDADLFFVEVFWSPMAHKAKLGLPKQFEEVSRFPTVSRDLAIVIEKGALVGDIVDSIRVAAGPLLLDVGVFDVYEGEGIEKGRRSVGFTLEFGADRTLVDAEVDQAVENVVTMLSTDWKAKLRS
jgi:phenylalanyl-tRNA synthetase beta chain